MHAIIRKGHGKYYVSAVFGFFSRLPKDNSYEESIANIRYPYFIVWNEEKTQLIKVHARVQNTEYIIPQVLIVDYDTEGWLSDEATGSEWIDFLPKALADNLVDTKTLPQDIKKKCLAEDENYTYQEYREITSQKDLDDLDYVSGGFHDGYIEKAEMQDDGSLYILMESLWGCSIELWFSGDAEWNTSPRMQDGEDPYWLDSSLFIENGFIYLVDDCDMTAEQITDNYCWFKGRHLKYHVIPD